MTAPPEIHVGGRIAERVELVELLGRGATGVVYRAIDRAMFDQVVAIKLLYPHLVEREAIVVRLQNEVRIARKLAHPHIARIFEWCSYGESCHFVVMEYVPGVVLSKLLAEQANNRLSITDATRILYETADALNAAHQRGIVHRDLKPQNLMLDVAGQVKILDFGIARVLDDEHGLTRAGESMGTPYYMSPEQFRGEPADPRSDIYSFGILAYRMVSGALPFDAQVYYHLASQHLSSPLPPLPEECRVPRWMEEMITGATRKSLTERTQSAEELADTLAAHLSSGTLQGHAELVRIWRANEHRRLQRLRRRQARSVGLGLVSSLMLLAAIYLVVCRFNGRQWRYLVEATFEVERLTGSWAVWPMKKIMTIEYSVFDPDALRHACTAMLVERDIDTFIGKRRSEVIYALLLAGADPNVPCGRSGHEELFIVQMVKTTSVTLVETALKRGADPNAKDRSGVPLSIVSMLDGLDSIFVLGADERFDPNVSSDSTGETPLHYALRTGNKRAVVALTTTEFKHPINPNIRNHTGQTPLEQLLAAPSLIQSELLSHMLTLPELDLALPDASGRTPLEQASETATKASLDIVLKHLVDHPEARPPFSARVQSVLEQRHLTEELALLQTVYPNTPLRDHDV